jgi:hypothetical protein
LASLLFGACPGGFLLSARPTQPAHGLPTAAPSPLPFAEALPSRVEQYAPVHGSPALAPVAFASARDGG